MDLDLGLLAFSFTSGALAFFNPCGFALLPAYVSYYLARGEGPEQGPRGLLRALIRGLSLGVAVSGGFITVFAILGAIVSLLSGVFGALLPWVGAGVGVGLFLLGALMMLGRARVRLPLVDRVAARIAPQGNPHPQGREQGLLFYYLYGVAYALASTSCTLPIFLIVVSAALSSGLPGGLVPFGAYALGMTLMMIGLSVLLVFSKAAIERFMGPVTRFVRWAGAVGVMAAGAYLVYYNLVYSGMVRLGGLGGLP